MSKHHVQAALRHVARIDEALRAVTAEKLADLDRRGRFTADPDGFPARTTSDGMRTGSAALTSVERGAEARAFGETQPDSVGDAIRSVFDALRQMSALSDRMVHSVGYVEHVAAKSEGRVSSLAWDCPGVRQGRGRHPVRPYARLLLPGVLPGVAEGRETGACAVGDTPNGRTSCQRRADSVTKPNNGRMNVDTLAERVGAGARWLDEHVPGWEHRIDLAKLDLKDTCLCVLGQVFEEQAAAAYYTGDERYYPSVRGGHHGFWFTTDMEWDSYAQTCEHGFGITGEDAGGDTVAAWHELQAAWVALLKARFDSGTLSDVEQTA